MHMHIYIYIYVYVNMRIHSKDSTLRKSEKIATSPCLAFGRLLGAASALQSTSALGRRKVVFGRCANESSN